MDANLVKAPICVDLLLPTGALTGAIYAAIDTFRAVNDIAQSRSGRLSECAVAWRLLDATLDQPRSRHDVYRTRDERHCSKLAPSAHATFIPPLAMITLPQLKDCVSRNAPTVKQIEREAMVGHYLCAIGTGAWMLAATGLLDGRRAPVQWGYQSGFAFQYPKVVISNDALVHASDRLLLASAPSLAHECALELVAKMGLVELAYATREKLLFNPARQFATSTLPIDRVTGLTRDSPLYRAVQWLNAHADRSLTIREAALHAAVSERTLMRLFHQHLGVSPHDFVTGIRLQRAQMWLEVTLKSVEEIAHDCGYADTSAFRRAFKGRFSLTPIEWRSRYTTRAPRARWKLEQFPVSARTGDSRG